MYIGFIGREAEALHGFKYALEHTYDLQNPGISEIPEVIAYQKKHGFKPIFMVERASDVIEIYHILIRGLEF